MKIKLFPNNKRSFLIPVFLSLINYLIAVDINGAVDIRFQMGDFKDQHFMLHGAEVNYKYTYADQAGDRLLIVLQIPYSMHWKRDIFLHHYGDAYMIVKGALGKPNLRIGRFDIPFGLLKTYDSHFILLPQLFEKGLGLKKDIGAEVFGYYKIITYDISFTQGFNSWDMPRNDRPITGRIGLENEAVKFGISYYRATHSVNGEMKRIGIDFEKNINPIVLRGEAMIGDNPTGRGFNVMVDFPFVFNMQGTGSGLLWHDNSNYQAYGLELRKDISFLTFTIGLIREKNIEATTKAILQTIIRI